MAPGYIPKPGQDGPCKMDCEHHDCAWMRDIANTECYICGEVIGYERGYFLNDDGYSHASCTARLIDEKNAAKETG